MSNDAVLKLTNIGEIRLSVIRDNYRNKKIRKLDHNLLHLMILLKDPWIVTGCDIKEIVKDMSDFLTTKAEVMVIKKETLSHAFKHGLIKIDII